MNPVKTSVWGVPVGICLMLSATLFAVGQVPYASDVTQPGCFCLAQNDRLACLYVHGQGYVGVVRAVTDLQADIARDPALVGH